MMTEKSAAEKLAEKLETELAGIAADYWRLSQRLARTLPLAIQTRDWASDVTEVGIDELSRAVRLSVLTARKIDCLVDDVQGQAGNWRFELQEERRKEQVSP